MRRKLLWTLRVGRSATCEAHCAGQSCPVKASDRGDGCVELAHSHWPGRRLRHACREREIHTSRHAREGWPRSTPHLRDELAFTRRRQFFLRTISAQTCSSSERSATRRFDLAFSSSGRRHTSNRDSGHYDFRLFMAYRAALYARSHEIPRALYRLSPHQVRNVRDRDFRRHRVVAPQALPACIVVAASAASSMYVQRQRPSIKMAMTAPKCSSITKVVRVYLNRDSRGCRRGAAFARRVAS